MRKFGTICAGMLVALSTPVFAQAPQFQMPPLASPDTPVVIRFFSNVDQNSVTWLLQTVDGQIKQGRTHITILMSSPGGDVLSGFTAYNYLKGIRAEVTTINIGQVDSAATIIFCAGAHRYSVPEARFLFHGVSVTTGGPTSLDSNTLSATLDQIKGQNQMIQEVVALTTGRPQSDVRNLTENQTIFTPEKAKEWHLIQDIKTTLIEPGATLAAEMPPLLQVAPSSPISPSSTPTTPAFTTIGIPLKPVTQTFSTGQTQ